MSFQAWAVGLAAAGLLLTGALLISELLDGHPGGDDILLTAIFLIVASFTYGALITAPLFGLALALTIALRERLAASLPTTVLVGASLALLYAVGLLVLTSGRPLTVPGMFGTALAAGMFALPVAVAAFWYARALRRRLAL